MTGQWRPTVPATGCIGVAITATMAAAFQQTIVTSAVRLVVTAFMVVVPHFT